MAFTAGLSCCVTAVAGAQSVPGFTVEVYSPVVEPVRLAFAPDSTLFVGRDPSPTGGGASVKIHRVDTDGSFAEYGNSGIPDPDAIVYDANGTVSGAAGSVIVGGVLSGSTGRISTIRPNGDVATLFESTAFTNPTEFAFDSSGRLLFSELATRRVFVTSGSTPAPLFTISGSGAPGYLAVDSNDRIFTSSTDGRVRIHGSNGSLIDDDFAMFDGHCALALGPGGTFGLDLFVFECTTGNLFRVDAVGIVTLIGWDFGNDPIRFSDIAFGPDGSLYLSRHATNEILRISPDLVDVDVSPAPPVALHAFPNPFATGLTFEAVGETRISVLSIFDAAGRLVRELVGRGDALTTGSRTLRWDGTDQDGRDASPGVYYVRPFGTADGGTWKVVRMR